MYRRWDCGLNILCVLYFYFTIILKGGYYEWIPQFDSTGQKYGEIGYWRGPGHFRHSSATSYHRIELDPTVECWTLFMPGPQRREWGFLVDNKWIHNNRYLAVDKSK